MVMVERIRTLAQVCNNSMSHLAWFINLNMLSRTPMTGFNPFAKPLKREEARHQWTLETINTFLLPFFSFMLTYASTLTVGVMPILNTQRSLRVRKLWSRYWRRIRVQLGSAAYVLVGCAGWLYWDASQRILWTISSRSIARHVMNMYTQIVFLSEKKRRCPAHPA